MADDRLARIDDVLQAALVRPPAAREAFVREACKGDASLADEVLSLLAHAAAADKFLEPSDERPVLTPGQTLGRYTVGERIGRGGMGEVYRARDSRPPRDIAIKILPPEFAADPERLQRFEREARAAGALNHPNIVTIHSVEESGDLHFLTMELVDGKPLSNLIPRDGLPLERLLEIAVQLADAVGTAHTGGIVHRDLKPANVMVTREGRVKVLDFGLAKLRPLAVAPDLMTPAAIGSVSEPGQLLGTIAYMSPEQAEGREVDHRSDVFSLGVVLYELATGSRPFTGDSGVSLLSAIIRDTPRPLHDVKPALPPEFGRIVRGCLMKDPARRYHSAIDVRNQLEELKRDLAASAAAVRSIEKEGWLPAQAARKRPRALRWLVWAHVGVGALATVVLGYFFVYDGIDPGFASRRIDVSAHLTPIQITIPIPEGVEELQGLAISPDGATLAFTGGGQLWRYILRTEEVQPVSGPVGTAPQYPFWSPESKFIAYFQDGKPGSIWKVSADGGIPTKIGDLSKPVGYGGSWNRDNTIIFAEVGEGLFRVSAEGGETARVTTLDSGKGETSHRWPTFLPDGRHFTYQAFGEANTVYIGSLDSAEPPRLLVPATGSRAVGTSGFLLTALGRVLRARPLSRDWTVLPGEAMPLADQIAWPRPSVAGDYVFAASESVLAYSRLERTRRFQFSIVDRNRKGRTVGPPFRAWSGRTLSLSHDGRAVAFAERSADNRRWQVKRVDLQSGAATVLTGGSASHVFPVWSPTDDRIVFTKQPGGSQDLHVKTLGTGAENLIAESSIDQKIAEDWHPTAGVLYRTQTAPSLKWNYWLAGVGASEKPKLWLESDANHYRAKFSPDGRLLAYESEETGRSEIYVIRFPGKDGKRQVSVAGGEFPMWGPSGTSVFFREGGRLLQVAIAPGATSASGKPREVFSLGQYEGFAIHPDGKRFILVAPLDPLPRPTITIVVNWTALLKEM